MDKRAYTRRLRAATALTALSAAMAATAAPTVNLGNVGYVTYGDARSYSLPIAGLEVMSGPGQISVFTKLGLGADGQLGNTNAGVDDAFETPNANTVEGFRTTTANEPNSLAGQLDGSWDRPGWWDASLSALNAELNLSSNSLVFFFANNEIGSGEDRASLAAWMRVEITQISTNSILGRFDLSNDFNQDHVSTYGGLPTFDGSGGSGIILGDTGLYTAPGALTDAGRQDPYLADFVRSGGPVCLQSVPGGEIIVDCAGSYTRKVEHNLGGDRAAYAIVMPELDQIITNLMKTPGVNLADYAIHVDYRLGCGSETGFSAIRAQPKQNQTVGDCPDKYALNGGDEKLFLGTQAVTPDNPVPEPGAIALTAAALGAMAWARRRLG
ncbi:MAG: PEP-CTERM sorting domain-containing protein [Methyloversatilis sp.]|nr:PEP-CTERM sorting domain-containing protein [Methyloversatilis sp.]